MTVDDFLSLVLVSFPRVEHVDAFIGNCYFAEARYVICIIGNEGLFPVLYVDMRRIVGVTTNERNGVAVDPADIKLSATNIGTDESFVVGTKAQNGTCPKDAFSVW